MTIRFTPSCKNHSAKVSFSQIVTSVLPENTIGSGMAGEQNEKVQSAYACIVCGVGREMYG